jgi:hypothetical protein
LSDNDHPQYLLTTAQAADSDTVDGKHATDFLGKNAKAADSDKLDGLDSTAFAAAGHDHDSDYLGISAKAADSDKVDGKHATDFLGKNAKAADSDKLDGLDSTDFVKNSELGVWNNWTPNLDPNGTGAVLSGYTVARYSVSGRTVNFTFAVENKNMTTRSGQCLIGLPVTASASAVTARVYASIYPIGGIYIPARCEIVAGVAYMVLHKDFTYSAWLGNETGLYIYISGFYEI